MGLDLFESYRYIVRSPDFGGTQWIARSRDDEVRIMDIALLPEYCNRGIGTTLLRGLQSEAAAAGKPLRIHVEKFNPRCGSTSGLGSGWWRIGGCICSWSGRTTTPNFQLPTPKGSRSNHLGETRENELVGATFTPLFQRSPWELEVGSWKLTSSALDRMPNFSPALRSRGVPVPVLRSCDGCRTAVGRGAPPLG